MKTLDTSKELVLQPWLGGIKLERIENVNFNEQRTLYRVSDYMNLPMSSYFLNSDSCTQDINEVGIEACGWISLNKAIGKNALDAFLKNHAENFLLHDKMVMQSKQIKIREHLSLRKDDIPVEFMCIKLPWFNNENEVIGVFGMSVVNNFSDRKTSSIGDSLTTLINMGLFNNSTPHHKPEIFSTNLNINGIYLSKRETECVQLLIKGKSAKKIARILNLSPRTIEKYLECIKIKMQVSSKSDLIEKIYNHFLTF